MIHNFVGHLCDLSAQQQEQRGGQGTAANPCLVAVPCPALRSCGWAESSLMQYRKIEIPNKAHRGNIPINHSHIHECRNWERGRSVSFLGIYVSNFRYSAPPPPSQTHGNGCRNEFLHIREWWWKVPWELSCCRPVWKSPAVWSPCTPDWSQKACRKKAEVRVIFCNSVTP